MLIFAANRWSRKIFITNNESIFCGIIKSMERIVHISQNFAEADEWDIQQSLSMTPEERLIAARQLALRVYGEAQPDIRAYHNKIA